MKRAAIILLLTLTFTGCHKSPSEVKLPSVIGDNMLLQQKTDASIFGKAHPGEEIQLTSSWGAKAKAIAGMDGKWSAALSTPEAGGPYTLTITAYDTTITVKNIPQELYEKLKIAASVNHRSLNNEMINCDFFYLLIDFLVRGSR